MSMSMLGLAVLASATPESVSAAPRIVTLSRRQTYTYNESALSRRSPYLPLDLAANKEHLENIYDMQYFGSIKIGNPETEYNVIFDTGSSDMWVKDSYSAALQRSASIQNQDQHISIQYGMGAVAGDVYIDRVDIAGASVYSQFSMMKTDGTPLDALKADGLVGMAFDGLAHMSPPTVLDSLQANGYPMFTMVLKGYEDDDSFFAFSKADPAWYSGSLIYYDIAQVYERYMWWTLEGSFVVGGQATQKQRMILDSGTSYLGLPTDSYDQILNEFMPSGWKDDCTMKVEKVGIYSCPCSYVAKTNPLVIRFGEHDWPIPASKLYLDLGYADCILQTMKSGFGVPLILGDTFLRTVAVEFDYANHRVGMAQQAKSSTTTSTFFWPFPTAEPAEMQASDDATSAAEAPPSYQDTSVAGIAIGIGILSFVGLGVAVIAKRRSSTPGGAALENVEPFLPLAA